MKKVLLSSVAALAVFAAAAPVFAQGENPSSSNQLIQKKYVSERDIADEANRQVAAHDAEIREEAQRQFDQTAAATVKAAEAKLKAFLDSGYSGHDFTDKKNALEAEVAAAKAKGEQAYNEIYNTVRNRYIQKLQEQYRNDPSLNHFNDPIKDQEDNAKRIADDIKAQTGKDVTVTKDENGNYVVKDEKGNVVSTVDKNGNVVKAGAKADAKGAKALPKTSAVK